MHMGRARTIRLCEPKEHRCS